jgi:AcrR family transcriptional regulator
MTPDRRTKIHTATRQEIISVAWKQIAEQGASALSLRAIARDMGMTAPALYRYFPDRDALVTELIVEAFTSLGEALVAGRESAPASDHAGRLSATGIAYREWAVAYPQRYALIFGTPVPGYKAPSEVTMPAAAQSLNVLIKVLDDAIQAGKLPIPEPSPASGALQLEIEAWRAQVNSLSHPYAHYLALVIWSRVHGLVSLEIGQQFPPTLRSMERMYQQEIQTLVQQIGIH